MKKSELGNGRSNYIMELLILNLLSQRDSYTYELIQTLEKASSGQLEVNENTVYTFLYKYREDSYVSEYKKPAGERRTRVYYHLEDEGRERLEKLQIWWQNMQIAVNEVLEYRQPNDEH